MNNLAAKRKTMLKNQWVNYFILTPFFSVLEYLLGRMFLSVAETIVMLFVMLVIGFFIQLWKVKRIKQGKHDKDAVLR